MRRIALAVLTLLVSAAPAGAVIDVMLPAALGDDGELRRAAADDDAVKAFRADLDRFVEGLHRRKQPEIDRLLGKPVPQPAGKSYSLPVGHYIAICRSGLRSSNPADNKDHTDNHLIGDIGLIEVWYGTDGQTPVGVVVYLAEDAAFPKLTKENLARRVAWDRRRFRELVRVVADARQGSAAAGAAAAGAWVTAADEWPTLPAAGPEVEEPEQAAGDSAPGGRRLGARGWWAAGLILLAAVVYSVWARRHDRRIA